ncbi:unnamed protein product [Agarophyton chilense]|eukprot:gb/GEZJ01005924.1/.p1 GENE.gb/GEZJ01005924.1/~~gb/GEZJ01005924.1/.p1  ORF type:complete len:166 (-),score=16.05 gb/GEZJ01005924.1/:772-1269(-)
MKNSLYLLFAGMVVVSIAAPVSNWYDSYAAGFTRSNTKKTQIAIQPTIANTQQERENVDLSGSIEGTRTTSNSATVNGSGGSGGDGGDAFAQGVSAQAGIGGPGGGEGGTGGAGIFLGSIASGASGVVFASGGGTVVLTGSFENNAVAGSGGPGGNVNATASVTA